MKGADRIFIEINDRCQMNSEHMSCHGESYIVIHVKAPGSIILLTVPKPTWPRPIMLGPTTTLPGRLLYSEHQKKQVLKGSLTQWL
nr:hypothetical protein Hi04_10k_c5016_00017 [uncultured bacterium]